MNKARIRKDYRALKPAQRKRFFTCLRMLDILPPQQPGNSRVFHIAWKSENGQRYYKTVRPVNIHDQFIASHQTSCQHGMPYFLYYHRHLLVCVQIALNYAEEVLLAGPSKIPNQLYQAHRKQWDTVFEQYKDTIAKFRQENNISGQLPELAMHYWDPSDYTQSIEIPTEIKEHQPDEIDELLFALHQHYTWNFNFASRWFKEQGYVPKGFQTNGFFQSQPAYYSESQRKIIQGDLNPRSDPQQFLSNSLDRWGNLQIGSTASEVNAYKNFRSLVQTRHTIDLCTLDQLQIDTLFGSNAKNLQWISKAQRQKINSTSLRTRAYTYNKTLPHFQYAFSLFKQSNGFFRNYVSTYNQHYENSIENCHNTMHNNLQRFMSDAQLSITHPIFFMFHSWMDMTLETKARTVRNSSRSRAQYNSARSFMDNVKYYSLLNQVVRPQGRITYAEYPIFQWALPINRLRDSGIVLNKDDYHAPFAGYSYVLNDQAQGIRLSDELQPFYKAQYVQAQAHRYRHYEKFNSFNFNYTYEIRDYNQSGLPFVNLMEGTNVPVPSFIMNIYHDYDSEWNKNKVRNIVPTQEKLQKLRSTASLHGGKVGGRGPPPETEIELKSGAPPPQPQPVKSSPPADSFVPLDPIGSMGEQDYYNQKDLLKAIREAFAGFANYSSTIKSVIVPVELEMTEMGYKSIPLNEEHTQLMKDGLVLSTIPLLTRGSGAMICPNCKPEKKLLIEGTQNLAQMNQDLFCALARGISFETIYQIENDKVVDFNRPRLTELFKLTTPKPVFNRLQINEGASEMTFDVHFHGKEFYQNSGIKINGYSYAVETREVASILSKSSYKLECFAQFPAIVGIEDQGNTNEYFLYRQVKVFITNGDQYRDLTFNITTYHDLIRYTLDIYQREGPKGNYLDVTVRDKDYDFKQTHYKNSQYVL